MATIDELVVKYVLDTTGFTKGQKDAAAATSKLKQDVGQDAKAVEASVAKVATGVEALGRKFLGLYALVTAGRGLREFVSDLTGADSALGRTAKNIDLGAKALSTWQLAAEASGGSAAGITGTMRSLSGELQRAALTGTSSIIPAFKALGINLATTGGRARDVRDILTDMNRRAQGMDPAKFTALANLAGISDEGTINLLEKSTSEFDKLIAAQEKFAATQADVDAAQKRQSGWRELLITSTSIGRTILTAVTPAIVAMMKAVQDWANGKDWTKLSKPISDFLDTLTNADWKGFITQAEDFATKLRDIVTAADDATKGVDSNSVLYKGLEGLATLVGVRVLGSVLSLTAGLGRLAGIPVTGMLARILMNPVLAGALGLGFLLASGDPNKAVLSGGHPDVQPQDNDLGLPGTGQPGEDRPNDTSGPRAVWDWIKKNAMPDFGNAGEEMKAFGKATGWGDRLHPEADAAPPVPLPPERPGDFSPNTDGNALHRNDEVPAKAASGLWDSLKRLVGFGDDPKVKDGIADTAKATKSIWDLLRSRSTDALSAVGINLGATDGRGGNAGMPNMRYGRGPDGHYRHGPGGGGNPDGAFNPRAPDKPGMYRPQYKLSDADLDDYVVGTVAGEAVTSNPESIDAVVNNMINRLGTTGWGPSKNLHDVASAPGQYAGHRRATAQEAERIRARIHAIASGGVPDNTNGSNSYRAAWYGGPWARQHAADGRVVGGNRFAYEPGVPNGPYAPYKAPHGTPAAGAPANASGDAPVGDQARLDAQNRITAGKGTRADHALISRYLKEQNTPPAPAEADHLTAHHLVRAAMSAIGHANRLTHHDGAPVSVDLTDRSASKIEHRTFGAYLDFAKKHQGDMPHARAPWERVSELSNINRSAAFAGHIARTSHSTTNIDRSSDTRIANMTIHTQAKNGREIMADLENHLSRSRGVSQSNSGLA